MILDATVRDNVDLVAVHSTQPAKMMDTSLQTSVADIKSEVLQMMDQNLH